MKQVISARSWHRLGKCLSGLSLLLVLTAAVSLPSFATSVNIGFNTGDAQGGLGAIQLLMLFTLLAVGPSLLIMMTSFTRIVIVFSFLRNALGLQQTPPNQVIIGLSLFLSLFIMRPVLTELNTQGLDPYIKGEITQEQALTNMQAPIKEFMLKQTKEPDLRLFLSLSKSDYQMEEKTQEQLMTLDLSVIIPAFITSELKRAFTMGFLLFLPFLIIDMVVSSTLMSMGMVMLPPSMISLPFKLMLFVVVNGWSLIMEMLVTSFY